MKPRIHFVRHARVWVSTLGVLALALGSLLILILSLNSNINGSTTQRIAVGLACLGAADVLVVTILKVLTGQGRRRAIRRAEVAWRDRDFRSVVDELKPYERDLDLVVHLQYCAARELLMSGGDRGDEDGANDVIP